MGDAAAGPTGGGRPGATGRRPVPACRSSFAPYARTRRIGDLTLEPVWPLPDSPTVGPGDGSTANNASVVLLARLRGVTFFLGGDIEPEGQQRLATALPGLRVDVLKVPHHGSRYQDLPFLQSLHARLAVISVGADNDYGHPAPETVAGPGRHGRARAAHRPRRERRGRRTRRTALVGDDGVGEALRSRRGSRALPGGRSRRLRRGSPAPASRCAHRRSAPGARACRRSPTTA